MNSLEVIGPAAINARQENNQVAAKVATNPGPKKPPEG